MKKLVFITLLALGCGHLIAQNKPITEPNYSLPERFSPGKVKKMVFTESVDPHFLKKSDRFWYEYETPEGKKWYIVDALKGIKKPLFDNIKMASDVTLIVKDPFDAEHLPIENIRFSDDENSFIFEVVSSLKIKEINKETGKEEVKPKRIFMEYNLSSETVTELIDYKKPTSIPQWASVCPNKKKVIFSRSDFNLYSMDWDNFEKALINENDSTIIETQITTDGSYDYPWGNSNYGKNNSEIKKDKNKRTNAYITWSPDGGKFALVRTDSRNVDDYWVINSLSSPRPTLETYKYHLPGELNSPQYYLYVFDMNSKSSTIIDTYRFKDQVIGISREPQLKSDRDNHIKFSKWLGDNDSFSITVTSRDLKRIDICRVDISSSKAETLIEERLNKSLETRTPKIVTGTGEIIHWSERNGWGHLYLYTKEGNLKNQITSGAYHVEEVVGVDSKNRVAYFEGYGVNKDENPYYRHLYRVNFDGSNLKLLNVGDADYTSVLSDNCLYSVNTSSRVNTAPVSEIISQNSVKITTLETCDLTNLFNAGYKFPELFKVKAADGITNLYGVMYKPFDFDSTRLYPIIEYVYPGPQTEAMNTQFTVLKMDRVDRLAQFGFIVVTVGNRGGHPNRSKWYHTYGYGNLRDYGLEDKKACIEQLSYQHKYIDMSRVGIHGHSGGGFMSTAAMFVYPDFFKVAVSCAGNHENNIYNRWWSEKHHGVEEEITEKGDTTFKYAVNKNSEMAKNLKGNLLLITGDQDNNVHPANTIRVVDALIRANKRFDMLVLPGQRHAFGDMTEYFFWKMGDYFSEHLIGSKQSTTDIPQIK